jgi:glutathione reductase (NADPH)
MPDLCELRNEPMSATYDLIVIGTGTAAMTAVSRCRAAGWKIAVIDERVFGGTCVLRGCDPKKVLVGAAEAVDLPHRLLGKGISRETAIDWGQLAAFKRTFTDPVPASRERRLADDGIDAFHGRARFRGPTTIAVDDVALDGRHILIAAGAAPVELGIDGEDLLTTSDDFLELERLPRRIALVGGGYIAFELAHIARRAGAEVTVLERSDRTLAPFDPDLAGWLVEKSRELGIDVRTETAVEAIERNDDSFALTTVHRNVEARVETNLVVHAAGRKPALDALDLAAGGVDVSDGRIELNEFLQSRSNPAVYAAGDAAEAGPPLTPVANRDGRVVASNLLGGQRTPVDYSGVPSVVFTLPPLAAVGLGEREARDCDFDVRISCQRTPDWYSSRRVNEAAAGFKILADGASGRLLGAHLLGPGADELINVFALAIRGGLTTNDLMDTFFAYPTSASNISDMLPSI